jgi:hypothetical protein
MSHETYNAMWRGAQGELRRLMAADQRLAQRPRETDKRGSMQWVLRLYADYIRITRVLDECHDQIVQPQKRILVGGRHVTGCMSASSIRSRRASTPCGIPTVLEAE